ncbi:MAG: response regulator transcription factor [Bacteroidales bacterium]|nr:response regulator transcription factor [Bacteroidales bacterium]
MKVLLVEDERELAQSIADYLIKNKKFNCDIANNYHKAIDLCSLYEYDCIIVDIGLPDGSGLDIISQVKSDKCKAGIVVISAKDSLEDKINGLNLGADDYLVKPFHLSELNARIHSLMRRLKVDGENELIINEISLNLPFREVKVLNNKVSLTKSEFDLLYYLMTNKNQVLSKSSIAEHLIGEYVDVMNSLDFVYLHVKNLRKKLLDAKCKDYIKTVYGVGYKFLVE